MHITEFVANLKRQDYSGRTTNLYVIALRHVLRSAMDDGYLKESPAARVKWQRFDTPKRTLVEPAQIDALCEAALAPKYFESRLAKPGEQGVCLKNGVQLVDFIRLLQYSGAREQEAIALRWADLDLERRLLTIGADGNTKNREPRHVDLNPKLLAVLEEMEARRAPDSEWLFPSPRRGERDTHAKTFRESLKLARAAAGMPKFGFHDCRHCFVSYAVMSAIDFMTIARWVGHKDGGVLIGKVYGHIADSHRRTMAQQLSFGPTALKEVAKA